MPIRAVNFQIHSGKKTIQYDHVMNWSKRNVNKNVKRLRQINTKNRLDEFKLTFNKKN